MNSKSAYWWYETYCLLLKVEYDKRELVNGLHKLWNRQDTSMDTRVERLQQIIAVCQKENKNMNGKKSESVYEESMSVSVWWLGVIMLITITLCIFGAIWFILVYLP